MARPRRPCFTAVIATHLAGIGLIVALTGAGAASVATVRHQSRPALLRLAGAPNDPDYSGSQAPYLSTIGVPQAWDVTTGSDGIVVAIVDSGVDALHPDLVGRISPGRNIARGNNDTADDIGHGTMMAGIVGAATNNGLGVAGVAWAAKIMPVKVTEPSGAATDRNVAEGIHWAVDHGADVVSISLSGQIDDNVLQSGVDYATARDVLVVAAAGNSGTDVPEFPAAARGVVAVGATDGSGHRSRFSNYGPWVDVNAPGVRIVTTKANSRGFTTASGTSAATALVAGVAVLLRAAQPDATQAEIADRLRRSGIRRGPVGAEDVDASGVVDAAAALRLSPRPVPSGPASDGYLLIGDTGKVDAFGGVAYRGDPWGDLGRSRAVGLETLESGMGYWTLDSNGRVRSFGGAGEYGGMTGSERAQVGKAVTLSAIPGDRGYWIFTETGRVVARGLATSYGDLAGVHLNRPIVAGVGTRTGQGYLMVADDGGVFAFGDARFAGSMGGQRLNAPIRSIAIDGDGDGYWLASGDGGVFAFDAPFRGSLGSDPLQAPVAGIAGCGNGYFLVSGDGGVFDFSDCPFRGALGDAQSPNSVVGLRTPRR
jgi:subtilisin family serine protease